jgi:hypothetical protein
VVSAHDHGLLRYARARGIVSLAVHYTIWGHRLILRLPAFNDAIHFLDRADVALDVDASSAGRTQIVRVAGTALSVVGGSVPDELDTAAPPWPEGLPSSAVIIVPESVRWLPVVDDVRFPPLPDPWDRLPATYAE